MIDLIAKTRVAILLTAAALIGAACDSHHDAQIPRPLELAAAAVAAKSAEGSVGTEQTVEDSELTTTVRKAIAADPQLQSQPIVVETEDAAVTLTGKVDSPSLRDRAVQLAGSIDGVAQVEDRLEVGN